MSPGEGGGQARCTAEAVARRSYGRLVAFLAARTRDVAGAEDALSEAFAAALADWPLRGCPSNPEAWLLTVARRKMIDATRRRHSGEAAAAQLMILAEGLDAAATDAELPDHRLALMFACAHPAIEAGVRSPLMLQVVLRLDAKAIASAFLMSPAAMGKRLVRAKRKIRQAGIPFRVPARDEVAGRLGAMLDAIYAGYAGAGPIPAGPTSPGAISRKKRSFSPGSRPGCCPTSPKPSACLRSCCTPKPGAGRGATGTAGTFRSRSRIRRCGTGK